VAELGRYDQNGEEIKYKYIFMTHGPEFMAGQTG